MAKSIFFSWQSDTPSSNGRGFLRKALNKACEELATDAGVSEAVRDEGLEVDSDTQGVAGQPPLVETILKKIDSASVFIADVTFTGARANGEGLVPNPNVLIEYGWAMKSLTHSRVISVMNEIYGKASRDSLPFDLAHIRWPIRYSLAEDAQDEEREATRKKLVSELKEAIKISLGTIPVAPVPEFPKVTSKEGSARFRKRSESVGFTEGFGHRPQKEVFLAEGSEMWLRLMPMTPLKKEWRIDELKDKLQQNGGNLAPLVYGSGYSFLVAEDGVGSYITQSRNESAYEITTGVAFIFASGEIWSIDTNLLSYDDKRLFQGDIENSYTRSLENYGKFLSNLNTQGPYRWMAGMRGIKGRTLGYPPPPGKSWLRDDGPTCMADSIEYEGDYNPETQTPTQALLPFFKKIFEKCAHTRPDYLPQA